jgi:hypothetical protein
MIGNRSTANALAGFQQQYLLAGCHKVPGCCDTGSACADNNHVEAAHPFILGC